MPSEIFHRRPYHRPHTPTLSTVLQVPGSVLPVNTHRSVGVDWVPRVRSSCGSGVAHLPWTTLWVDSCRLRLLSSPSRGEGDTRECFGEGERSEEGSLGRGRRVAGSESPETPSARPTVPGGSQAHVDVPSGARRVEGRKESELRRSRGPVPRCRRR